MRIRRIERTDLQDCLAVIHKSFATVAEEFHLSEQNCPKNPSFMKMDVLKKRFANGVRMFGLYEREKLVGFASLSADEDHTAKLYNLAVLPDYRHHGYGRLLLDYCETEAKEMQCSKIRIDIIEDNTILKDWYLKNGFVHLFTKRFEPLPFTVGFMEKPI